VWMCVITRHKHCNSSAHVDGVTRTILLETATRTKSSLTTERPRCFYFPNILTRRIFAAFGSVKHSSSREAVAISDTKARHRGALFVNGE